MSDTSDLRQRIVDAATEVLEQQGPKRLTQPVVAKLLGIRQSHLTYYFPRRADLLMALADRFLEHVANALGQIGEGKQRAEEVWLAVNRSITAPGSMRSFLGLLIEAEQDPTLRELLAVHSEQFVGLVARELGRSPADADVRLGLAALRGIALDGLLHRRTHSARAALAIGRRLGLVGVTHPPKSPGPPGNAAARRGRSR
ncbi:MAG TPA: TetR/AcrR family transcriptional regulator [Polyangiaceae bacterium]|nr:TetR/AcrR family transcriptional regulator [Polyangiaceae bacterium]